jgi:hypothetical protein
VLLVESVIEMALNGIPAKPKQGCAAGLQQTLFPPLRVGGTACAACEFAGAVALALGRGLCREGGRRQSETRTARRDHDSRAQVFLSSVGLSMPLSFAARLARGPTQRELVTHTFKRASVLAVIGLLLNLIPAFDLATLRIPGILQRIALCYAVAGCMTLPLMSAGNAIPRTMGVLAGVSVAIMLVYWLHHPPTQPARIQKTIDLMQPLTLRCEVTRAKCFEMHNQRGMVASRMPIQERCRSWGR